MKRQISVIAGFLILLSMVWASAQDQKDSKYVFTISKINYLKAIDDAVVETKAEGLELSEARVILCGESVNALVEENAIIKKALRNPKIKLYACGLSLEQMNLDTTLIPKGITTVRNGILEAMKLEQKGYRPFDF